MNTNAAFDLQLANARLDERRREAADRRLRRLVRSRTTSAPEVPQQLAPTVVGSTFASALDQLGHLVEGVRQADRSPDFELAVVALIGDLLDVADASNIDDVPARPTGRDPFVAVLRAAGRLAAVTAAADLPTDAATCERLQRRLDRVRRARVPGSITIVPELTAAVQTTCPERHSLGPIRAA